MTLEEALEAFDGCDTAVLADARAAWAAEAGFLDALVELTQRGVGHVPAGASWILKEELCGGARLAEGARLVAGLESVGAWQAQLHLCQCLEFVEFSEGEAKAVARWAKGFAGHKRPFLRAWSLHLRVVLSRRFAVLAGDAEEAQEAGKGDAAASVRARMRHLE